MIVSPLSDTRGDLDGQRITILVSWMLEHPCLEEDEAVIPPPQQSTPVEQISSRQHPPGAIGNRLSRATDSENSTGRYDELEE